MGCRRGLASVGDRKQNMADASDGPIASGLSASLTAAFAPTHLEVINESSSHNVKPGSESHFKVVVVSAAFAGMPPLERHRAVNDAVSTDSAALPVHALSIVAKTPEQWAKSHSVPESPPCLGGSKN